jgi:hypothetical protein
VERAYFPIVCPMHGDFVGLFVVSFFLSYWFTISFVAGDFVEYPNGAGRMDTEKEASNEQ